MTSRLRPGVIAALAVLVLDQVSKLWLLRVFDIGHRGAVQGHAVLRPGAGVESRDQLRLVSETTARPPRSSFWPSRPPR